MFITKGITKKMPQSLVIINNWPWRVKKAIKIFYRH